MKIEAEQMNLSDLGISFGKMSQAHSPLEHTKAQTSVVSSKKSQGSSRKMPIFLDLQRVDGLMPDASWEMDGAALGVYTAESFGEKPSTLTEECCFQAHPNGVGESRLSQILEDTPHPKYCLSERACQGILNRANRRGKKLPPQLEEALIAQATRSRSEGGVEVDSLGKKAGKGALVQTEKSGTLGASQDQTLVKILNPSDSQGNRVASDDGAYPTLRGCGGGYQQGYCLQSVCYGLEPGAAQRMNPESRISEEISPTLRANMGDNQASVIAIENHPNDSRAKIREDGVVQTLSGRMGTGGNNVPLVMEKNNG